MAQPNMDTKITTLKMWGHNIDEAKSSAVLIGSIPFRSIPGFSTTLRPNLEGNAR